MGNANPPEGCVMQLKTKWSVSQITSRIRRTFGRGRWTPKKSRLGKDAAMPGPRPALCTFPEDFLQEALDTVSRRTVAVQNVQRFRLVLLLHERPSLGNDEAAAAVGLSTRQVQRWRSRWAGGDFSVEDHPGRGRKAAFSESIARKPGRISGSLGRDRENRIETRSMTPNWLLALRTARFQA